MPVEVKHLVKGATVLLDKDRSGVIRYVGPVHFKKDLIFYGIELLNRAAGNNDGMIDSIRYFNCINGKRRGVFVTQKKIRKLIRPAPRFSRQNSRSKTPRGNSTNKKRKGRSRRQATFDFSMTGENMPNPLDTIANLQKDYERRTSTKGGGVNWPEPAPAAPGHKRETTDGSVGGVRPRGFDDDSVSPGGTYRGADSRDVHFGSPRRRRDEQKEGKAVTFQISGPQLQETVTPLSPVVLEDALRVRRQLSSPTIGDEIRSAEMRPPLKRSLSSTKTSVRVRLGVEQGARVLNIGIPTGGGVRSVREVLAARYSVHESKIHLIRGGAKLPDSAALAKNDSLIAVVSLSAAESAKKLSPRSDDEKSSPSPPDERPGVINLDRHLREVEKSNRGHSDPSEIRKAKKEAVEKFRKSLLTSWESLKHKTPRHKTPREKPTPKGVSDALALLERVGRRRQRDIALQLKRYGIQPEEDLLPQLTKLLDAKREKASPPHHPAQPVDSIQNRLMMLGSPRNEILSPRGTSPMSPHINRGGDWEQKERGGDTEEGPVENVRAALERRASKVEELEEEVTKDKNLLLTEKQQLGEKYAKFRQMQENFTEDMLIQYDQKAKDIESRMTIVKEKELRLKETEKHLRITASSMLWFTTDKWDTWSSEFEEEYGDGSDDTSRWIDFGMYLRDYGVCRNRDKDSGVELPRQRAPRSWTYLGFYFYTCVNPVAIDLRDFADLERGTNWMSLFGAAFGNKKVLDDTVGTFSNLVYVTLAKSRRQAEAMVHLMLYRAWRHLSLAADEEDGHVLASESVWKSLSGIGATYHGHVLRGLQQKVQAATQAFSAPTLGIMNVVQRMLHISLATTEESVRWEIDQIDDVWKSPKATPPPEPVEPSSTNRAMSPSTTPKRPTLKRKLSWTTTLEEKISTERVEALVSFAMQGYFQEGKFEKCYKRSLREGYPYYCQEISNLAGENLAESELHFMTTCELVFAEIRDLKKAYEAIIREEIPGLTPRIAKNHIKTGEGASVEVRCSFFVPDLSAQEAIMINKKKDRRERLELTKKQQNYENIGEIEVKIVMNLTFLPLVVPTGIHKCAKRLRSAPSLATLQLRQNH